MNVIKKIAKWIITIILIPIAFLLVSLILTFIPINNDEEFSEKNKSMYLTTNGIHLNIIIPKDDLDQRILDELIYLKNDNYFSFGWGDKNFYLNTPTWSDLTLANAFNALILKSSSLIHLTRYVEPISEWIEIKINQNQLEKINQYIFKTFHLDTEGRKVLLENKGYTLYDDFYEALGSYSLFNTCNTWVNSAFKESNIKACLWTPYDFGLLKLHKK